MDAANTRIAKLRDQLTEVLGKRCSASQSERDLHGQDESYHPPHAPDLVCYPESVDEVVCIVDHCRALTVPIVPYGVGTSIEGQVLAINGGVSLDMSRMNRVIEVRPEDMLAVVEPGVTRNQLNEYIRNTGLMFPVDPGADATIGGMASTRASGTQTVRYGSMRENTLSLQAVLASGKVIRTTSPVRKSSAGYDLTRLFVGSEGTLGVLTEIAVRLYPIPDYTTIALCFLDSIPEAIELVVSAMQYGVSVARMELIDETEMRAICKFSELPYEPSTTLFVEFHGDRESVRCQVDRFEFLLADMPDANVVWLDERDAQIAMVKARHDGHYANLASRPGSRIFATDTCVPLSRLAECINQTQHDLNDAPFPVTIGGHVGDGNFHLGMLIMPDREEELSVANRINARLIERSIDMGGTCSGEHGIGIGKIDYLKSELGDAVELMRAIKESVDPQGIMNPGKVFAVSDDH